METLFFIMLGMLIATVALALRRRYAGFFGQSPENYEDGYPVFELKKHLNGKMICDGVIFGPLGRVTSTFVAAFDITWDGDRAVMDEVFRYNDGSTQNRRWIIHADGEAHFTTEAEDVPKGGSGRLAGAAVQMRYAIRLPESAGGHLLDTVDWMYLTPDGTIVNRSQFRKFGFKVAELVATIRPKEA